MSSYAVVDTDVFSYLWQSRPEAARFDAALRNVIPALSFATVAEAHFGATYANWGERKLRELEAAIRRYVVVPYNADMAKLWGKLRSQATKTGHPLGQKAQTNDLWVATTALFYDAPLLTNNRAHFAGMPGLKLITPDGQEQD